MTYREADQLLFLHDEVVNLLAVHIVAVRVRRPEPTHLDIHDRTSRQAYARLFGVTEEQLRKAARLVGTRVKTLRSHLVR